MAALEKGWLEAAHREAGPRRSGLHDGVVRLWLALSGRIVLSNVELVELATMIEDFGHKDALDPRLLLRAVDAMLTPKQLEQAAIDLLLLFQDQLLEAVNGLR